MIAVDLSRQDVPLYPSRV